MKQTLLWGTVLVMLALLAGFGYWGLSMLTRESNEPATIAPETAADYLHAVIEANRTVYTKDIVDKMQQKGIVEAAEHWKQEASLPLPAQFLIETGKLVAEKEAGIKYRLVSLSPIYVWNAPQTDFERRGLEAIVKNPAEPFKGYVRVGRERFFQAIYADLAVSASCVACHNAHPNSPRRNYKLNDVMGGLVITIPVGR
ncbi:MAG: DUF3365 domain-containing protein [Nitrospirota bacterium]